MSVPLHDRDFHAWAITQSELLRQRRFHELDMDYLIDEIEDMGKSERRVIESQLERLLHHLLKWQYQPEHRSGSWSGPLWEARKQISKQIKRNPSLQDYPQQVLADAYEITRIRASAETGFKEELFPENPPYSVEEVLEETFFPQ
jgi:hypothetical protein